MKQLQALGVVERTCSLSKFKEILADNEFNIDTPPNTVKDYLQLRAQTELTNREDEGERAEPVPEKPRAGKEKAVDELPSGSKEAPRPQQEEERIVVKTHHRKAYKKAIQAGKATPGNIQKWLRETGGIHTATLEPVPTPEEQPPQATTEVPSIVGGEASGKHSKKSKKSTAKAPAKVVFDDDGNPITAAVTASEPVRERPEQQPAPVVPADPDAWRAKNWLSAVECEQRPVKNTNGYTYSAGFPLPTPDFPFNQAQLQPQHQGANQGTSQGANQGKKRKRGKKGTTEFNEYQPQNHNYPESASNNQSLRTPPPSRPVEDDAMDCDDLPTLPADISTLPNLTLPLLQGTVTQAREFPEPGQVQHFSGGREQGLQGAGEIAALLPEGILMEDLGLVHRKAPSRCPSFTSPPLRRGSQSAALGPPISSTTVEPNSNVPRSSPGSQGSSATGKPPSFGS